MTDLKIEMMKKMNDSIEKRKEKNQSVYEIESMWRGDMILLDKLQENYDMMMKKTEGDKVRCCPRDCYCHRSVNGCMTLLRDIFRSCGCCCCQKHEPDQDLKDIIYCKPDDINDLLMKNTKKNENLDEENPTNKNT